MHDWWVNLGFYSFLEPLEPGLYLWLIQNPKHHNQLSMKFFLELTASAIQLSYGSTFLWSYWFFLSFEDMNHCQTKHLETNSPRRCRDWIFLVTKILSALNRTLQIRYGVFCHIFWCGVDFGVDNTWSSFTRFVTSAAQPERL